MPFQPLTSNEVLNDIRTLTSKGKIRWTDHVEDRMVERGFDRGQIKACLLKGYFREAPTIPNRPRSIEYKFTMQAVIEGEQIAVAASLIPDQKVVVITVLDPN